MPDRSITVRLRVSDDFSVSLDRYSQKIRQADADTKRMSNSTSMTGDAFNKMGLAIAGAITAFGLRGVKRMAEDLYEVGVNARRTEVYLQSWGNQVGNVADLMTRLRSVSRGVVDDASLMQGASVMMSMGLAHNADDLERLTEIGVGFAQAMGKDVQSSMENLYLLLANQSYLRLDTLGISAGQVRELRKQYREAGLSSSDAFVQAFMDVAERKLPQMMSVADAAATPVQRFQTHWDNAWQDLGEGFATAIDGILGIAEKSGPLLQAYLFGWATPQAMNTYLNLDDASREIVRRQVEAQQPFMGDTTLQRAWLDERERRVGSLVGYSINEGGADVTQLTTAEVARITGVAYLTDTAANELKSIADNAMIGLSFAAQQLQQANAANGPLTQVYSDAIAQMVRDSVRQVGTITPITRDTASFYGIDEAISMTQIRQDYANFFTQMMQNRNDQFASGRDLLYYQLQQAGLNSVGDLGLSTDDRLRMSARARGRLENEFDLYYGAIQSGESPELSSTNLEALSAVFERITDSEIFSEADITRFQGMLDIATGIAEQAEEAAKSYATLSDMFGQTTGGRLGEIDAAVLAGLEASGMSEEMLDALQTGMGLDSGQLTQMSEQFDNDVVPILEDIASQLGVNAYNTFRRAYDAAAEAAADAGRLTVGNSWMGTLAYMPGTGGGETYEVQPGDTLWGIGQQYGLTPEQLRQLNGLDGNIIQPGQNLRLGLGSENGRLYDTAYDPLEGLMMENWRLTGKGTGQAEMEAADRVAQLAEGMQSVATDFEDSLSAIFGKKYQLDMALVVSDAGIWGPLAQAIAAIVNANGGTTPGTNNGAGRSSGNTKPGGVIGKGG